MSLVTNLVALTSQRLLADHQRAIGQSLERLATGRRINRAADDPAGLIAADGLAARNAELTKTIEQAERAKFVVGAAEGGLSVVQDLLVELDSLVLQAANTGGRNEAERDALQLEANSIIEAIDFVIGATVFGGERILADGVSLQIGGSVFTLGALSAKSLGGVSIAPPPPPPTESGSTPNLTIRRAAEDLPVPGAPIGPDSPVVSDPTLTDISIDPAPLEAPTLAALTDIAGSGLLNLVDGDLESAQNAVKGALDQISNTRARLGSFLKFDLGSRIDAMRIELENSVAAESQIRDADFAAETSALVRGQILAQAATFALSTSFDQQRGVISLLAGPRRAA